LGQSRDQLDLKQGVACVLKTAHRYAECLGYLRQREDSICKVSDLKHEFQPMTLPEGGT